MEILYGIIGVFLGALGVYFFVSRKINTLSNQNNITENQLNTSKEELGRVLAEAQELKGKYSLLETRFLEKEKAYELKLAELEQKIHELNQTNISLVEEKNKSEKEYIKQIAELSSDLNSNRILLEESKNKVKEQEEKFSKIEENFKTEFKNMAQEILEEKSKKFTELGKKDLSQLIEPLKERIKDFSKQVRESYENENKERFSLKEEIKRLNEMNIKLSDQATNLATALKGESKTQGDWGEMILENLLSNSGLSLGREYFKQETIRNEEGSALRPDFIIKYPDNRFIIIDSKVSLRSYESYVSAETAEDKKHFLEQHLKAVNERVKELSSKNYQDQFEGSPDFVMMFMPIEPAFMLAIQKDGTLWNKAYEKRVILISATNLIAALKMISELWKHDDQNKNSLKIAEAAGNLYDKFVAFYKDLDSISQAMDKVSMNFEAAKGKLYTGRGNLVGRVEKLKTLGVKTKKNLEIANQANMDLNDEPLKLNDENE